MLKNIEAMPKGKIGFLLQGKILRQMKNKI